MDVTPQLFSSERHQPIGAEQWDAAAARNAIAGLSAGAREALANDTPWHDEGEEGREPNLYFGTGGVCWALRQLAGRGLADTREAPPCPTPGDCEPVSPGYRKIFEQHGVPVSHSFLLGPVGALMLAWQESGDPALLDRLDSLIGENRDHPWMENLWGAPSTTLAAVHLYEATGDARFAAQYRAGADYLWQRLEYYPERDCRLWRIPLYGGEYWLLGAGHGFVGNAFPVLRGLPLLDEKQQSDWIACIAHSVRQTAEAAPGIANWRQSLGENRPGRGDWLVQHCHGAPGVVIDLASLYGKVGDDFDALLLAGGELVWRAGPLTKYPGLCHGTPGNGYAFLKLYTATGDEGWLDRARAFAAVSLQQRADKLAAGETPDYSLWNGDMGLAMYLADCLEARSAFPTMDYF